MRRCTWMGVDRVLGPGSGVPGGGMGWPRPMGWFRSTWWWWLSTEADILRVGVPFALAPPPPPPEPAPPPLPFFSACRCMAFRPQRLAVAAAFDIAVRAPRLADVVSAVPLMLMLL